MQVVRTILWILLTAAVVGFVTLNWGEAQDVTIWPGDANSAILFEWPVGFIALFFFVLGFLPMWLYHRGSKWRLNRRIKTLENAARAAAVSKPVASPPPSPPQTSEIKTDDTLTPTPETKP